MNDITRSFRAAPTRRTLFSAKRRTLPLLLTLAAALSLGTARPATAQSPTPASPAVPTPYSWPGFHAGGTSTTPLTPTAPYTIGTLPAPDALFGMLQGTPTSLVTSGTDVYDAEIPSFLLGNYNPLVPPGGTGVFAPNHFADDTAAGTGSLTTLYYLLQAPFPGLNQALLSAVSNAPGATQTSLRVDDSDAVPYPPTAASTPFSLPAGAWAQIADPTADTSSTPATAAAVTTGYERTPAVSGAATAYAKWQLAAPAAGAYNVTLHLPASSDASPPTEVRIPDARYRIYDVAAPVVGTTAPVADVRISQTESNDPYFLAGPFQLTAGQVLTVVLDNTTQGATSAITFVIADSATLRGAGGTTGEMQGSPVAINDVEYPEIHDALYLGGSVNRTTSPATVTADDSVYGNATVGTTPTAATSLSDAQHRIRQLVYFGRFETIQTTNAGGTVVGQNVGAIYCMDGNTGGVVWRYQTPPVYALKADGTVQTDAAGNPVQAAQSREVYSTPVVARIHVLVSGAGATALYATKLVVIVGDNNGMVYCLDALGNRDGTSNANAYDPAYSNTQPVFLPQPAYGATAPTQANKPGYVHHVGTTPVYWVFRPGSPKYVATNLPAGQVVGKIKPYNASSDLPPPGAFGFAAPALDVKTRIPYNAADLTEQPGNPGLPAAVGVPTFTDYNYNSAIVYIGNRNGTLYKLNTLGVPVAETAAAPYPDSADLYNASRDIDLNAAVGVSLTPTVQTQWWFNVNQAPADNVPGTEEIVSAPTLRVSQSGAASTTIPLVPTEIYFGTADQTHNVGNVYRLDETGPVNSAGATITTVGNAGYNVNAQAKWAFPDKYANNKPLALGSVSGSPVLFTNPADNTTRLYFAANANLEGTSDTPYGVNDAGRIWCLNPDTYATTTPKRPEWVYPNTYDPNSYNPNATGTQFTLNDTFNGKPKGTYPVVDPLSGFSNATPAIGIVQFPAVIQYGGGTSYTHTDHGGTAGAARDVKGAQVPMLYIGSQTSLTGQASLYGIDLDGVDDIERTIFTNGNAPATNTPADVVATSGVDVNGPISSSAALVVNSTATTATPGNGGALFVTVADAITPDGLTGGNVYQYSATPQSNDVTATAPVFESTNIYHTAGPYSSPAVAAFDATDLNDAAFAGQPTVIDWVYVGDDVTGLCVGLSPSTITNFGTTGGGGFGFGGPGGGQDEIFNPPITLPQFPLYVYLFKDIAKAQQPNMGATDSPIGGVIPPFEWGDNVYIRVADVVAPNDNDNGVTTDPTIVARRVPLTSLLLNASGYFLTNGSPVSIQISETDRLGRVDVNRGADVGQVPATLLSTLGTNPPGNGFIHDATGDTEAGKFQLKDATPKAWIGAYTYAIGDGSARKNTPGSRRRIITATQTAQAWGPDLVTGNIVFKSTVTLTATVRQTGDRYKDPVTGTLKYLQKVDQPTFAILNPLALSAFGQPIASISPNGNAQKLGYTLGPFDKVPMTGTTYTNPDLPAFSNGNRVYQSTTDLPVNGVLANTPKAAVTPLRPEPVITSTDLIGHGLSGATADAASGVGLVNMGDRSALGVTGRSVKITMVPTTMQWNDNTHAGGATGDWVNGQGSIINPAPWDSVPTAARAGTNHSLDYPDIASRSVRQILQTQNNGSPTITSASGTPDPATGTTSATRTVTPETGTSGTPGMPDYQVSNHLKVQIAMPKYQPANTQLYEVAAGSATGNPISAQEGYDKTQYNFPMGYTAQMRVFVDSDHNHTYTSGEAYRDLTVYTGVPMDMGTTITSATTDLGALTQGFGVQTLNYTPLGAFDPYSPAYQSFFRPITAFNNGNVNLLNVQFDQRVSNGGAVYGLPFLAGPLDTNSALSGYDFAGITGPAQSRFTLRSSLDNDLIGTGKDPRNPGLTGALTDPFTGQSYKLLYPGVTFHKNRPGDGGPAPLRVPDVPHDNNVPAFYLASATVPTVDTTTNPATHYAAAPYIGMAVPIGTPVGTYSQNVRLFEGLDTAGFDPLKGPTYGGAFGGRTPPNLALLTSALTIGNGQPYSTATQVVAKVEEARITDSTTVTSTTAGTLPHGDITAFNKGDFSPAAFRNLYWNTIGGNYKSNATTGGNVNLFWTSSRDATGTPKPPYNVVGKTLPYTVTGGLGYFDANVTAPTAVASWYTDVPNASSATALFPDTAGLNTGLSFAPEQHAFNGTTFSSGGTAYAFVQNLAVPYNGTTAPGATSYQNIVYCLQVNPATGAFLPTGAGLGTAAAPFLPDLTAGPAPAFGTDARVVSSDPAQAKFGVKGLKVATGTAFIDPLSPSTAPVTINRDLWAFWGSGARGRSSIAYTSTTTGNNGTVNKAWMPTASLPVPAGLSSTADPSPVLTTAPDKNGNAVPAIDVTYTGIGPDGSTDLYVSRYRPYIVQNAAGAATAAVGLALSPFAAVTETLQSDPQVLNWQARDVAWVRDIANVDVALQTPLTAAPVSLGLTTLTPQYDRATGTLVYTGVTAGPTLTYPNIGAATVKNAKVDTVYVDLVRGRIRFRVKQTLSTGGTRTTYSLPTTDLAVTATFAPEARRITADTAADTEPVTFMDEAFKPNEASFQSNLGRVQANRAWFIWRKAAFSKTAQPTLFYKTQRLTVALVDSTTGLPDSIQLDTNGKPQVDVTAVLGGVTTNLYARGTGGVADVDWARGRIYLPLTYKNGGTTYALEGQPITVTGTSKVGNALTVVGSIAPATTVGTARWQDEPRFNDIKFVPDDTSKSVPISTAVNEGTASAFLDPMAYADVQAGAYDPLGNNTGTNNPDQPHKVWLYWSSTRNGTADIYSEAIEPRFSVRLGGGSVP